MENNHNDYIGLLEEKEEISLSDKLKTLILWDARRWSSLIYGFILILPKLSRYFLNNKIVSNEDVDETLCTKACQLAIVIAAGQM